MPSSTAAQVRTQPAMSQPKYGNIGDDHGACRSRRMTTPRFTALSATTANAMVIETEPTVVVGSSGPHSSTASALDGDEEPADRPPDDLGRVDDAGAGPAGWEVHDAGVGHVGDEADDDGDHDEELAEQQLHREQGDAAVDVEDRGEQHQLQHRRQDRELQLDVGGDAPVDVSAEVDGAHEGGEVVVGEDDLGGLLGDLRAAAHGDADVGLLEGGGVVDGVAGHGDDLAGFLHQPGEAELVLGGDAAEDVQLRERRDDLFVAHLLEVGAGDDARAEPELVGDGAGGDRVVAGDHAHVDAGVERGGAPRRRLRAGAGR